MQVTLNTQEGIYNIVLLLASTPHKHDTCTTKIRFTLKLQLCFHSRANFIAFLNFHLEV